MTLPADADSAPDVVTRPDRSKAIALYLFDEGEGNVVHDRATVEPALDLTIEQPDRVEWLTNGLRTLESTILATDVPAKKIIDASRASDELTVEVWVTPASPDQQGPARIVTVSPDQSSRNFMLGQSPGIYVMRLRTDTSTKNGGPELEGFDGSARAALTHVVFTHDSSGRDVLFVDGVFESGRSAGADLELWNESLNLALGNEFVVERPWLGVLHLVAIYDHALSAEEIVRNFEAGP